MSDIDEDPSVVALLTEIRDDQRQQLALQQRQVEMMTVMQQRSMELQDRAEKLQDRSAWLMDKGRKVFTVVLPILFVLLAYAGYLVFRIVL